MISDLDRQIARSMEAEVRLLPLLPELLADLRHLGSATDLIVSSLRAADLAPESNVLDLGCGKGAVAVSLAERLSVRVEGIDAFQPFLDSARAWAEERGVNHRCLFRKGDIRQILGTRGRRDAVMLCSVGPVLGDHRKTVAGLRTLVRDGGLIVLDDGYLADAAVRPADCGGYADHAETLRRLTAHGDQLVREVVHPPQVTRSLNRRNTKLIARRAAVLKARRPDLAEAIDQYVARQRRETEVLGRDLICAVWTLRVARKAA